MIKAILVDDELNVRNLLRMLVNQHCADIAIVAECNDLPEAIKCIHKHSPDLVFLDIEMPGHSGLELLDFFNEDEINFSIVFVTAYNEYAIQAFKLSAIDYILKPVSPKLIAEAIDKYKKIEFKQHKLIEALKQNLSTEDDKKIAIPSRDNINYINPRNIIYVKADGAYSVFHILGGEKYMLSRNLKYVEEMTSSFSYIKRCHKSYIVNTKQIKNYNRTSAELILSDNSVISISDEKVSEILP